MSDESIITKFCFEMMLTRVHAVNDASILERTADDFSPFLRALTLRALADFYGAGDRGALWHRPVRNVAGDFKKEAAAKGFRPPRSRPA